MSAAIDAVGAAPGLGVPDARPVRVLHIITGLEVGGAEGMLLKLLSAGNRSREVVQSVIALRSSGPLAPQVAAVACGLDELGIEKPAEWARAVPRFRRAVLRFEPDVIQGWMYHGNLAASLARRLSGGRAACLWNIRQTFSRFANEKRATAMLIRLGARLSAGADGIVYNSQNSLAGHAAIGYATRVSRILPNGFDLTRYRPDGEASTRLRAALGLPPEAEVIGHIARYHPMKNHAGLLQAASIALRRRPELRFVLIGPGVEPANDALNGAIESLGLSGRVHLLGERRDIPALVPGFDLLTLASTHGEAFPNVLGEAMACGVVCVATDVGDSAAIIGPTGRVVRPGDVQALADAWCSILSLSAVERNRLSREARERVETLYGMDGILAQYVGLWKSATQERIGR